MLDKLKQLREFFGPRATALLAIAAVVPGIATTLLLAFTDFFQGTNRATGAVVGIAASVVVVLVILAAIVAFRETGRRVSSDPLTVVTVDHDLHHLPDRVSVTSRIHLGHRPPLTLGEVVAESSKADLVLVNLDGERHPLIQGNGLAWLLVLVHRLGVRRVLGVSDQYGSRVAGSGIHGELASIRIVTHAALFAELERRAIARSNGQHP